MSAEEPVRPASGGDPDPGGGEAGDGDAPDPVGQGDEAAGRTQVAPWDDDAPVPGAPIVRWLVIATILLAVVAVLSAAFHFSDDAKPPDDSPLAVANVVTSLALFAVGCVAFAVGFLRAIGRSRTDEIDFPSLFFLAGRTAPKAVKTTMLACYGAQLVVAVGTAAVRPFTDQAFVIMAPMCAQGAVTLWSGTFGRFGDRRDPRPTRRAEAAARGRPPSGGSRATRTSDGSPSASAGSEAAAGSDPATGSERSAGTAPGSARRARTGARGGPRPRRRR